MAGEQEASVESQAREMGWAPKEEFKGDPEKWIDAEAFVERGQAIMPIMRANNERLLAKVGTLESQLGGMAAANKRLAETIETLKEFQEESAKQQFARAKQALLNDKKLAKKEGDVDAEVEIDEALDQLEVKRKAAEPKKEEPKQEVGVRFQDTEWYKTWAGKNTWVDTDPVKSATALGVGRKLRDAGMQPGPEFLEKISEEVEKIFNPQTRSDGGKVEGSRGGAGGNGGGGGSGKHSYSELPTDAKEACDRFAGRLVGKGKAWESIDAYRKHYVTQYFAGE